MKTNTQILRLVCACAVLVSSTSAHRAFAESPIAASVTLLASGDHDKVEAGIQGLGLAGGADAVAPLVARIRDGLPPDLLETAILTLMALGQPQSGPVLFELVSHRRPEIRVHAIEAIAAVAPSGAEDVLRAALSDGDSKVRSAAATGLGELKAAGAVEVLFRALDRGNLEASTAIGKILKPHESERLLAYLGKIPLRNLGPAFSEILRRKDVPERDKLTLLGKLQDLGTPEAKAFFGDLLHAAGESLSPAVSRAALRAMQGIAK
jgi:HEAT repeat protein